MFYFPIKDILFAKFRKIVKQLILTLDECKHLRRKSTIGVERITHNLYRTKTRR